MGEILPNKTYRYKEVQEFLGVKKYALGKVIKKGVLSPKRIGKTYIFLGSNILNYLRSEEPKQSIITKNGI